jgi:hypothetical protein
LPLWIRRLRNKYFEENESSPDGDNEENTSIGTEDILEDSSEADDTVTETNDQNIVDGMRRFKILNPRPQLEQGGRLRNLHIWKNMYNHKSCFFYLVLLCQAGIGQTY